MALFARGKPTIDHEQQLIIITLNQELTSLIVKSIFLRWIINDAVSGRTLGECDVQPSAQ